MTYAGERETQETEVEGEGEPEERVSERVDETEMKRRLASNDFHLGVGESESVVVKGEQQTKQSENKTNQHHRV